METFKTQSLFESEGRRPVSVTELNSDIRSTLERSFSSVWVEGEITNFHSAASGHWYFSLTDGDSLIKAACFKGQNYRIKFKPFDGLQVRVRGRVTTYEKRGEYQILAESLEPVGEGALTVAFEQIKAKLQREGLFDPALKRPLPTFPRRVGVVTSPTGAAIHDIATVLERRARSVNIVIVPTLVQGEYAGEQIAAAIELANEFNASAAENAKIDVLIVGRGGGSAEDLWAFNEEQVARAIRASRIPVISAVGHEVDFTIADLVADVRAATPSAAAEMVAMAEAEVIEHLNRKSTELVSLMTYRSMAARGDLQALSMSPVFSEFPAQLRELRHRIDALLINGDNAMWSKLKVHGDKFAAITARLSPIRLSARVAENARRLALLDHRSTAIASELTDVRSREVEKLMGRLDALSPLSVLTRGYSIVQKTSGEIIRDSQQASVGEHLKIRLANGRLEAEVTQVEQT